MTTSLMIPDADREIPRYRDFFARNGVSKETVIQAADLTYQRSEVFFRDLNALLAQSGEFTPACKMGCAYCCHTMVTVLPPEAFYLARHIKKSRSSDEAKKARKRVIAHDKAHRGKSGAQRHVGRIACSLLDPDTMLCTVHEARPLTCRAMHSGDVKPCREAFETANAYLGAPSDARYFKNTQAYYDAFAVALGEHGLKIEPLELNAALSIIWKERHAFERWVGGEDIFAPARADLCMTDEIPEG